MSLKTPELLLKAIRGNIVEREHFGFVLLMNNKKILKEIGDCTKTEFSLRSCQKPFQALPLLSSGAMDNLNISLKELAVCCASHTGSKAHVSLVQSILNKAELSEKDLKCGIHPPLDKENRFYLEKENIKPDQRHNNCSGKHAGMLAVCKHNNWDIKTYLDCDHPLQKQILEIIKKYCELKHNPPVCIDGCGTPVYAMPLYNMAKGYLNLFLSKQGQIFKKAFYKHPYNIGGHERLDTAIIQASEGTLIAKVGAEGLCIVFNPKKEQVLAVKIHDASMQARAIVVVNALIKLNWLSKKDSDNQYLKSFYDMNIRSLHNDIVGKYELCLDL